MAAVILLQVTASSQADESVNEVPAIKPVTYPAQAGKPETEAQHADTSKMNKIVDHAGDKAQQGSQAQGMPVSKPAEAQKNFNWSKHMPAAATRRQGEGVGYPGYRGQGGTGYPQHRQYGNPPRYPAADQATQSSSAKNNAITGETSGSSPEHEASTADPRRINTDKRRALLHAAAFGDFASVNKLLKQGANPNARANDRTGRSAVILAAAAGHVDIVEALLESEAKVDERDKTGHTALNWAAMRRRTQVAEILLNKGGDINTQNNNGVSPVHYAIGTRNIPMLKLLVANNANLEVEGSENKMTPLLLAIELDDIESLNILFKEGVKVNTSNRDNFSPLMAAAEKGQNQIVQMLLSRNAEINAQDNRHLTVLIYAADNMHVETMKLLLAAGADTNARDIKGRTAVMRAATQGYAEVIRILYANGADVNAPDSYQRTALMLAAAAGQQDAVKVLLESGAGSNAKDYNGMTALMVAERFGHAKVVEMLNKQL